MLYKETIHSKCNALFARFAAGGNGQQYTPWFTPWNAVPLCCALMHIFLFLVLASRAATPTKSPSLLAILLNNRAAALSKLQLFMHALHDVT